MGWAEVLTGLLEKLRRIKIDKTLLIICLVSRFIVFFAAILGYYTLGVREPLTNESLWDLGIPIVNLFSRWDSGHYINIALNWYSVGPHGPGETWAFFPLYPMLMRGVGSALTNVLSPFQAAGLGGFLISNVLFFVLVFYFCKLTEIVLKDHNLAVLSAIIFSFWPGALFYSCVYPESLYMTFLVVALYLLEKDKNLAAIILGFLAGWTRPTGFLIFVPFIYGAIEKRKKSLGVAAVLVSSPYLLFNAYGFALTGIFPVREWVYAKFWGQSSSTVFGQLFNYPLPAGIPKTGYELIAFMELAFVMAFIVDLFLKKDRFLATLSLGFRKHPEAKYCGFAMALLPSILVYGTINNLHRYAVALIPLYWFLAREINRNRNRELTLLCVLTTMLVIGSILFATWRWYL